MAVPLVAGAVRTGAAEQAANDNQPQTRSQGAEEKKTRISNMLAIVLIATAVFFDLLQLGASMFHFIPGLGTAAAIVICWFITLFSQITFGIWFLLIGVNGGKTNRAFATRILIYMSTFIVEMAPLIDALPAITLEVVALILLTRAEDMFGGDIRQVRFSQLRTLMKSKVPAMQSTQQFYEQERADLDEAAGTQLMLEAEQIQEARSLEAARAKQKTIDRAMDVDLSGAKFTEGAERYIRMRNQRKDGNTRI